MNRSFWLGAGIGAVAAVVACSVLVSLRGEEPPRKAGGAAAAPVAPKEGSAEAPASPDPQGSTLKEELAAARREAERWKQSSDAAQARVVSLHHAIAESGVDKDRIESALKAFQNDPERLRKLIKVGEDLPEDVSLALGLQASQRDAVNALFKREAAEMYAALRAIAAGDPSIVVPAEDGPDVFMALNNRFGQSRDLHGKVFDSLKEIRRRTLAAGPGLLDAAQQAKFKELLSGNYGFGGARYYFREPSSD